MLGCAVAGGLMVLTAGRVWGAVTVRAATGSRVHVELPGHDVVAALSPLGVAVLVLGVVLLATRSWLRRAVGAVVVVIGAAIVAAVIANAPDVPKLLSHRAFAASGAAVHAGANGWAVLAGLAGGLAVFAGALVMVASQNWPALGARYDGPAAGVRDPATTAWDALDRGEDPTI